MIKSTVETIPFGAELADLNAARRPASTGFAAAAGVAPGEHRGGPPPPKGRNIAMTTADHDKTRFRWARGLSMAAFLSRAPTRGATQCGH